jgi:hypothetical protein
VQRARGVKKIYVGADWCPLRRYWMGGLVLGLFMLLLKGVFGGVKRVALGVVECSEVKVSN